MPKKISIDYQPLTSKQKNISASPLVQFCFTLTLSKFPTSSHSTTSRQTFPPLDNSLYIEGEIFFRTGFANFPDYRTKPSRQNLVYNLRRPVVFKFRTTCLSPDWLSSFVGFENHQPRLSTAIRGYRRLAAAKVA